MSKKYTPWDKFDPWEYAERNYGGKVLPEDELIIKSVCAAFKKMGVKEREFDEVADIGTGPNFYPAMLLAPFVKDKGTIKLIEYSLSNRDYLETVLNSRSQGKAVRHYKNWEKFGKRLEEICGEQYKDCFSRTQKLIKVESGNIYELLPKQFSMISSFFVAESITDNLKEFQGALTSLLNSLKSGGIFIIAHMLESKGYHTGIDTNFPAISLTAIDLEKAYSSIGIHFKDLNIKNVYASKNEEKPREGYHGMAIVVGRRID